MRNLEYMNMHVEQVFEQGSGAFNEDCLIAERDLFGVFDGATSLDQAVYDGGKSGGAMASTLAGEAFRMNRDLLINSGLRANDSIRKQMDLYGVDVSKRCSLWSSSAAVVRVTTTRVEWFQTGDSQIIFIGRDGGYKVAARRQDHDYLTLSMIREKGRSHPDVGQLTRSIREDMNRSYGVLNGEPEAQKFFCTGTEEITHIKTILLFTDGLDIPCSVPQQYKDFSCLVRLSCSRGLSGLRDYVRSQEALDPDMKIFPRFKKHDDIAAIALHF